MLAAYVFVAGVTIALNAAAVFVGLTGAMIAGFTQVGLDRSALPLLASLLAAGAAVLLAGLIGMRALG